MSPRPLAVRAYRAALSLLPPQVRRADGEEMVAAFAALWDEARRSGRRLGCLWRSFGRLPWVAALEWRDTLAGGRAGRRRTGRAAPKGGSRTAAPGVRLEAVRRALRYAARSLGRSPAFTWSTILLLGLGVGAVTTIFTLVDHVMLRPLPYPAADRLVRVENGAFSGADLQDFQGVASVEAWAGAATGDANLTGRDEPVRVRQARVTEGFFALFGARPALGRLLLPEDWDGADAVVLSSEAWRRLWGADPGIVGRTLRVNGKPVTVVGVLDPSWVPPEAILGRRAGRGGPDVWRPVDRSDPDFVDRSYHLFDVVGRLRPGVPLAAARDEMHALALTRAKTYGDRYVGRDGKPLELPLTPLQDATVGRAGQGLGLLLGAVTLLLLVACANVAHLFMARSLARGREMAVRRALGAGERALAGQLLAESLLVAGGGAALGVGLAALGLEGFLALRPDALPRSGQIALDLPVLAFAAAVATLTALAFGLLPAWRAAARGPGEALRGDGRSATGGRGARTARGGLVVAEVALSLVLVAAAGLLLKSFQRLHRLDLGFRVEGVWTVPLNLTDVDDGDAWRRRMGAVRDALASVPGVRAATYGMEMPLEYTGGGTCCWSGRIGLPGEEPPVRTMAHTVTAEYFDVLGLRFVAGRPWRRGEVDASPLPAVVGEPLAVELFGSAAAAVGREVAFGDLRLRVAGVVGATYHYGPDQDVQHALYMPVEAVAFPPLDADMAVAVDRAPDDLPDLLRRAVWSVEPDLPVPTVRSMESSAALATAGSRFDSLLFTAFGVVALLLAAGGLYGTLLYTVGMERREMGIRLALGAARRSIQRRVMARGLSMAAAGAVLGAAGAWAAGRLLESRLAGVPARDPAVLAAAALVLLATAALASWLPARRAAATDPVQTLRQE